MRLLAVISIFLIWPVLALAQTASLVADRIFIEADEKLIAEGNVEVVSGDRKLTASRVVYNDREKTLEIIGPILLTQSDGTVIRAAAAEIDDNLELGIMTSARLVLDRQLQLAAAELSRVSGRYTRLSRAIASSCEICDRGSAPLWELRARQVIRDEEQLQLVFDDAQLRVLGLPVAFLPRLRIPDPSNKRTAGFLVPEIRTRSELGTGIITPYFRPIGDHADLTFSPYLSPQTTTLEIGYRQAFARGDLTFDTAFSSDELRPDALRAYFFANGRFSLPEDFFLGFNLRLVSDDSYLFDYDYYDADRLLE